MPDMRELRRAIHAADLLTNIDTNNHVTRNRFALRKLATQLGVPNYDESGGMRWKIDSDDNLVPYADVAMEYGPRDLIVRVADSDRHAHNPLDVSLQKNSSPLDEKYALKVIEALGILNPRNQIKINADGELALGMLRPPHRNMNQQELDLYKQYLIGNVPNALHAPLDDVWLRKYTDAKWGPQHVKLLDAGEFKDAPGDAIYRGVKNIRQFLPDELFGTRLTGGEWYIGGRYYSPYEDTARAYSVGVTGFGEPREDPWVIRAKILPGIEIQRINDMDSVVPHASMPHIIDRDDVGDHHWDLDGARTLAERGKEAVLWKYLGGKKGYDEFIILNQRKLALDSSSFPEDYEIPQPPEEETGKYKIWYLPENSYKQVANTSNIPPEDIEEELIIVPETGVAIKVGEHRKSNGDPITEMTPAAKSEVNRQLNEIPHTEVLPHRYSVPKVQGPRPSHVHAPLPTVRGATARRMGYTALGKLRRRR